MLSFFKKSRQIEDLKSALDTAQNENAGLRLQLANVGTHLRRNLTGDTRQWPVEALASLAADAFTMREILQAELADARKAHESALARLRQSLASAQEAHESALARLQNVSDLHNRAINACELLRDVARQSAASLVAAVRAPASRDEEPPVTSGEGEKTWTVGSGYAKQAPEAC